MIWSSRFIVVGVFELFFVEFIGFFHELAEVLADALPLVADAVDLGVVLDGVQLAELGGDVGVEFRTAEVVLFVRGVELVVTGVTQSEPTNGDVNECEFFGLSLFLFGSLSSQLLLPRTLRVLLRRREIKMVKHRGYGCLLLVDF